MFSSLPRFDDSSTAGPAENGGPPSGEVLASPAADARQRHHRQAADQAIDERGELVPEEPGSQQKPGADENVEPAQRPGHLGRGDDRVGGPETRT